MPKVSVTAAPDHLDRFIKTPRTGLLELIWNALDADATEVKADIEFGGLGGVAAVTVTDNGTGISSDRATSLFESLGGSWKKQARTTDDGRALHGRLGNGRFAAYGIGNEVTWRSTAMSLDGMQETTIRGSRSRAQEFDIESKSSEAVHTGTVVEIADLRSAAVRYVESNRVADDLTAPLALYLEQYHPRVTWRGKDLDPSALIVDRVDSTVTVKHDGEIIEVPLTIIEWSAAFDRALYLCDANGLALHELRPGIKAPGYHFTAYARWSGFASRVHDLLLEGAAEQPVPSIIDAVQDALRAHFKQRNEQRYTRMIESWKAERSYPFSGEAEKGVEQATRDLFDIVAVAAAPAVEKADPATRKLSLRLLREAVEHSPDTVHVLLQEVLNLTDQDAEDLRSLVSKTSLANVISSAKIVTDRLEFLASLEAIVNEKDLKKVVEERSQLHRILAGETWIFGEEFALVGDDQTLRTVLRQHLDVLGDEVVTMDDVESGEVADPDGHVRVIDLMFAKTVAQRRSRQENLVIELKRPSVHVGRAEITQIENYAEMVAADTRFAATDTSWEFWIIGDKIGDNAKVRTNQSGREPGVTMQSDQPQLTVRAVTWAQIIRDAKHRMQFVRESLDYDPDTEAGMDYLRDRHSAYLPPMLLASAEDGGAGSDEPEVEAPRETADATAPSDA